MTKKEKIEDLVEWVLERDNDFFIDLYEKTAPDALVNYARGYNDARIEGLRRLLGQTFLTDCDCRKVKEG